MHAAGFFASLVFLTHVVTIDLVHIFVRGIRYALTLTCHAIGNIECMFFQQEFG
jgi:hypothetical protein